jgi:hypothetical protein
MDRAVISAYVGQNPDSQPERLKLPWPPDPSDFTGHVTVCQRYGIQTLVGEQQGPNLIVIIMNAEQGWQEPC